MLAEAVVEQIRDLLAIGELSQRKIARRLGVSRGSVNAISQDRRPDYARSARAAGQRFPQSRGGAAALSRLRGDGANALSVVLRSLAGKG